ncbi:GspH/FimT family pseudopilin [Cupriavidus agavae]|uniref:Type II secretion system protein H n=1 Tax=Cupriavidus agavae TaxID=1001822 RepID=A0A4Q7S7M6_9BURK|nr:GspH/FimT family pseudopilin [Cupriavidus agavae]RZT41392.1 type IV fimbrial biogenesis protein FimT [Cupriavidus agavae]
MTLARPRLARPRGFTLIELLVTVAVGVVLIGFAMPGMTAFMKNQRLMTAADSLNNAMTKARTVAAATNSYVTVAPVDGDWKNGWRVFNEHAAPDGTYTEGVDTLVTVYDALPAGVEATTASTGDNLYISFSPVGYSQTKDKAQMFMSVQLADDSTKSQRIVEVSLLGRSRVCNPVPDATYCALPTQAH